MRADRTSRAGWGILTDLRHLVVEGDALVGRRLVGGEDPADDVGPRRRDDVGKLLVPERIYGAVEVRGRPSGEAAQQHRPGRQQQRFQP